MRFQTEHHFDAPLDAVEAIIVDPAFYLVLTLPDLSQPELLDQSTEGDTTTLKLRYEFVGSLDPIAQRLLGSNRLAWIQSVSLNRSTHDGLLRFEAEKDPRRLHGTADFVLRADGTGSVRRVDGELVVAVPGIGRMAERRIVPGVVKRLEIEAEALSDQLPSAG